MSMKTKEEVKKTRGQEAEESRGVEQEPTEASTAFGVAVVCFSTSRLLDSSTPLSAEQSENVYENKGPVLEKELFHAKERWDTAEGPCLSSLSERPICRFTGHCDAPLRKLKSRNEAGMSMKTNIS